MVPTCSTTPSATRRRWRGARHGPADHVTITIRVVDDGAGVPAEAQERIFQRFARLSQDYAGAGLGLPIARWIAEAHGGSLVLESTGPAAARSPSRYPALPAHRWTTTSRTRASNSVARICSEAGGMLFHRIPMTTHTAPTDEQLARFLDIVSNPTNQPVYAHCAGGRHRTGVPGVLVSARSTVSRGCVVGLSEPMIAVIRNVARHVLMTHPTCWSRPTTSGPRS